MKLSFAALSILFLATSLQAQPPSATPEKAVVEGRVVRAGTGEPLKKAWVVLQKVEAREMPRAATTDANGKFVLTNIEPGRYRLVARRNGYVTREYGQRAPDRPGATLMLAPGQQLDDILFELIPAAVIAGRVYDEDGEPTPGVVVEALRYLYIRERRQLVPAGRASTDDRGEYRIFGLEPGTYYVSATLTRGMNFLILGGSSMMSTGLPGQSPGDEGYVPTFFPGTTDAGAATPVEVRSGDEVNSIDFLLLPVRTVRVSGRVFNAVTGRPGRGTDVRLVPRGEGVRMRTFNISVPVTQPDGSFEIRGVVPGAYHLVAGWSEDETYYSGVTPVDVGPSGLDGVSVTIEAGIEVSGRVHLERPRGPAPATAADSRSGDAADRSQAPDLTDVEVYSEPKEYLPIAGRFRTAHVKEDLSFTLRNVNQGEYWVGVAGAPPDYYLKAARQGGEDVLENGLEIAGGRLPGPLEITVSPNGARVEGVVLTEDNQPFGGAQVTLVPETRRRDRLEFYKTTTTDQYGRFTMRGIPPGEYKLFAWEEIERGAQRDPEFLKPHEGRGQEVRLREGDQSAVELKLIRPGEAARR